MMPTSAVSFSSRRRARSSPFSPRSQIRGACRTEVAKLRFPRPRSPPRARTTSSPGFARSARISPVLKSRTTVPTGTKISLSAPLAPQRAFRPPSLPSPARNFGSLRNAHKVERLVEARIPTDPPSPPFPPSGPPRGLRRLETKLITPLPPRPPWTRIVASSINMEKENRKGDHPEGFMPHVSAEH